MRTMTITLIMSIIFGNINGHAQPVVRNDSVISLAMSLINTDSITAQVQWLQNMETRFLMKPNRKEVAEAIKYRFESYGMTEVRLDSFQCYTSFGMGLHNYDTTTWQYNVEAIIPGSLYPDQELILLGHHDCMAEVTGPMDFAPGADDNASGTVAALESARVLMEMEYQPEKTLVFLTTAAEELMYFGDAGSEHYAAEAAAAGRSFELVINNDMISYNDGSNSIYISNIIGFEQATDIVALVAYQYCSLIPEVSEPIPWYGADLQPFQDEGWPGVAITEMGWNPNYHTQDDVVENCDMNYLTEAIKISCASMIYGDISVGTPDMEKSDISFNVYPNPCCDNLRICIADNSDKHEIMLMDMNGKVILHRNLDFVTKNCNISMKDYPSGVYTLRYNNGLYSATKKVVKL